MKILQLANRVPWPLKDGGAIGIYNLAFGYASNGSQVTMFAFNTEKHKIDPNKLPGEFLDIVKIHSVVIDTSINLFNATKNLFSNEAFHISRFESDDVNKVLSSLLERNEFDLIHLDGPFWGSYVKLVRSLSTAKLVLRAHNVEHLIWKRVADVSANPFKKWYLKIQSERLKKYEIELCNNLDAIIAISKIDQDILKNLGVRTPILISPAGINTNNFQVNNKHFKQMQFCFIGSLDWMPNLEALDWLLGTLWPLAHQHHPNIKLKVAGRNMPDYLKNRQINGVEIVGEVSNAHTFMQENGVLIVPLRSGSGMRIKILEAMALGVPILSSNIGVEGIEVQHGNELFIFDDKTDFLTQIDFILKNSEAVDQARNQAFKLIETNYDNTKVVKKLLTDISSL